MKRKKPQQIPQRDHVSQVLSVLLATSALQNSCEFNLTPPKLNMPPLGMV